MPQISTNLRAIFFNLYLYLLLSLSIQPAFYDEIKAVPLEETVLNVKFTYVYKDAEDTPTPATGLFTDTTSGLFGTTAQILPTPSDFVPPPVPPFYPRKVPITITFPGV